MQNAAPHRFLRAALAVDAVSSAAMGVLLAAAASPLSGFLSLPMTLLRDAGLLLAPFAAVVGWLASRPEPSRPAVWAVIGLNLAWSAESLLMLATGWVAPNALGTAFVIAQALFVLGLAEAEYVGLRRIRRGSPAAAA
ncbi:hypothetical protein [Alsobacter sp. SYSU BS001988]|jgi:hypothetical protein